MCQQFLSGFEELRVILDLPQIPIHRNPLRFECSGEGIHHTREVLLRASIADDEVRILCEKAEVCQRINLGHGVPVVIQHRLGEDVVNLETAKLAEHPFAQRDRKSTRLNSSHVRISYAVFCLKKKIQIDNYYK